jgi:hypothetical protein
MVPEPVKHGTWAPFGTRHRRDQANECTGRPVTTTADLAASAYYSRT